MPLLSVWTAIHAVALLAAAPSPPASRPLAVTAPDPAAPAVAHVVIVSIDGLRPDAVRVLGPAGAPALHRMRAEGATTDNARADSAFTTTLPNHTAILTARLVAGAGGHAWTENGAPGSGQTLHSNRGAYVASAFDVAHDAGFRTALFASKSKFRLFDVSYDAEHGASDTTGADFGPDKIDRFVYDYDTERLVGEFVAELRAERPGLSLLHLRDPDKVGHRSGWDLAPGSPYLAAVEQADRLLGRVLDAVGADPALAGRTVVIVTADHGGSGHDHGESSAEVHYTVPFYVWGAGVEAGADLYALNRGSRLDPKTERTTRAAGGPPIHNADAANLAVRLLGLGPVPGGTVGAAPLAVSGAAVAASTGGAAVDTRVVVAPNPSSGAAVVAFGVAEPGRVRVGVYDALGREVAVLADEVRAPGRHAVRLEGLSLPPGVYAVRVSARSGARVARLTVVR